MSIRLILSAAVLLAATGSAASGQRSSPREAAKTFTLDGLPTDSAAAEPSTSATAASPTPAPAVPENAAVATPAPSSPAVRAVFTLDTPIQDLIADARAKAVLDKDLPGMSDDENLDKFKMLSLRALQPQTGGQLTGAMLAKVASDLDVLGGGAGAVAMPTPAPVKAGDSKRNGDTSR